MKSNKLRNILRAIVCTIIGAYILLLGVVNFSPTEQWITRTITEALSEKLGTKVSISNIEIGLFNRLIIKDLEIKDLKGEQMLSSHVASAKIELRSLFKEQLSLRTVSLLDCNINLYKEKADSAANYQFIIDALSSKDKTKKSKLNLRINSIILRRVNVAYNERYAPLARRSPIKQPMTDAIIRPRVQPLESPRQCKFAMLVSKFASIFTRLL